MRRKQSPGFATSWLRLLLLSLFCTPLSQIGNQAYGQSQDPDAQHAMVNAGFERIRLSEKSDTVYASFESTQIRGAYRALGSALRTLASEYPGAHHFRLIIGEYGRPQIAVDASNEAETWRVSAHYDVSAVEKKLAESTLNPTVAADNRGKIDITLNPIVSIDNHLLDKLALFGFYLAPSFETTLWRGNRLIVQPIVPLYTNIADNDPDSQFQWGVVGLRQDWVASKRWRSSSTAGLFLYDLAGLHHEVNYHVSPTLDLGLRISATTRLRRNSGKWESDHKLRFSTMAVADYYEPSTSLQLKLSIGSFTYGDFGGRLDVVRHFGEYAIGAYAIFTDGERNAGFNFAIPLGPKRQSKWQGQFIRLRIPHYFSWEYSMLNYYRYAFEHMGVIYKEIPDKSFTTHYWQAAYLEHYLQRFLDNKIN